MRYYDANKIDAAQEKIGELAEEIERAGVSVEDYFTYDEDDEFPIALRYFYNDIEMSGYSPMWLSIAEFIKDWEDDNDTVVWYASVWTNSEGADRLLLWFIDKNGDDKADTLYLDREYDEWYKAEQGY